MLRENSLGVNFVNRSQIKLGHKTWVVAPKDIMNVMNSINTYKEFANVPTIVLILKTCVRCNRAQGARMPLIGDEKASDGHKTHKNA